MYLLVSDLHLTSKPRDQYRWDVFPWLQGLIEKHDPKALFILGDLTDSKDAHAAQLVNKLVENIHELSEMCELHIIKGNHDFIDATTPFFKFFNFTSGVNFHTDPTPLQIGSERFLLLPYTPTPTRCWSALLDDPGGYSVALTHITVQGALAASNLSLDGVDPAIFGDLEVVSGDIHTPQQVGNVLYVGSPYQTRYERAYDCRALLGVPGGWNSIPSPLNRRYKLSVGSLSQLATFEIKPTDQIKVELVLTRADLPDWKKRQREVADYVDTTGAYLHSVVLKKLKPRSTRAAPSTNAAHVAQDPKQVLAEYCSAHGVEPELQEVGKRLLGLELRRT